jgi:hypothetical protein
MDEVLQLINSDFQHANLFKPQINGAVMDRCRTQKVPVIKMVNYETENGKEWKNMMASPHNYTHNLGIRTFF